MDVHIAYGPDKTNLDFFLMNIVVISNPCCASLCNILYQARGSKVPILNKDMVVPDFCLCKRDGFIAIDEPVYHDKRLLLWQQFVYIYLAEFQPCQIIYI